MNHERRVGKRIFLPIAGGAVDSTRNSELVLHEPITTIKPEQLTPLLTDFYGGKDWKNPNGKYWEGEKWNFQYVDYQRKANWPEGVRETYLQLKTILEWANNPETRGHLDPVPGIPIHSKENPNKIERYEPPNLENPAETDPAVADLAKYYFNSGEPRKILPLMIINQMSRKPVSVLTIRWKGDPYVPEGGRIASIERLITDPFLRRHGLATILVTEGLRIIFEERGFAEVRVWIMSDKKAGNYSSNMNLFVNKFGFRFVQGEGVQWRDFAAKRGIITDRNAFWLSLKKERWELQQQDKQQPSVV